MDTNGKIICTCTEVTEKEITDSIENHDCNTVEKVGDKTGAGTICGGCKRIIENLLVKST